MKPRFDHEKLDVYRLELEFLSWSHTLIERLRKQHGAIVREPCDHLGRAALSALLNTAEGNGKRQAQVRCKFFDDARGAAVECAACLDALVVIGATVDVEVEDGKDSLKRIVGMLTALIRRFTDSTVREDTEPYGFEDEEEDEGEEDSLT